MKLVAENRKAYHDYEIDEKMEAGIVLVGSEIKSIRNGRINLKDSYCIIKNGELFLLGAHISTYDKTSSFAPDPTRTRKLLMHRSEIDKLERKTKVKGFSLVPLKVYIENGLAKIEIGVAKGKKEYEKRNAIKDREVKREIQRSLKEG
jgi:SsrA-binding protein